ncbi:MAG: ABC transporter substrate-binding protein [Chloroflexi bacterium]|nr:ABC transporter substrate-binding protein [Chloroflexota bacterium]
MRVRYLLLVVLAAVVALAGCSGKTASQAEPRKVTIAMGFIPNVQFTPMYVALEKGYFADEGLEVERNYGMETDLLQEVGTNNQQFAIASGDQVVLARSNGLPVRYVANWYRRFPVCVVSLAEQGIEQPEQLAGKTVGTPVTFGASYIGWLAFLAEVGMDPASVNLQTIGYTQVASLTEQRVDAAICYAMNEPVQLREAGYDINTFYLDRYTQLVSNGIITNDETIKKDPELVRAVVRAFLKGLQDTIADPDEAFEIARRAIPEMDDATAKLQRAVLAECITFWEADNLGENQVEAWQSSVDFMHQMGLISEPVDVESLYSNDFLR